jgi:hypothetical protein
LTLSGVSTFLKVRELSNQQTGEQWAKSRSGGDLEFPTGVPT